MRVGLVGASGVGSSIVRVAARRDFLELMVVADYDRARAERAVAAAGDGRFLAAQVDASDQAQVTELLRAHRCDVLLNATDPCFVLPLFHAALEAGADYLDMAMSLSRPHSRAPWSETGVKLGDEQFAEADAWVERDAWPWSASAWSRGCRTCSPATPPKSCSIASTRSASATAPTWWWRATPSHPPSRSGPPSRSASTRR